MHLGKREDDLADQLALRRGQLQEGIEGFALQIAHAFVPAFLLGAQVVQGAVTEAQLMWLQFEPACQLLQLVLGGDGLAVEPLPGSLATDGGAR